MPVTMSKKWLLIITAVLLMLSCLIALTACEGTAAGYNKYTQRKGIAHFSFECPESYEKSSYYLDSDHTSILHARHHNDGYLDSWFRVRVFEAGWGDYSDATDLLEKNNQRLGDSHEDYQILDRSSVSIDGVNGKKLISSYTPDTYESDLKESTLLINRKVYFDHNGLIWEIMMISIEEVAEADEPGWEHLLETFRILD